MCCYLRMADANAENWLHFSFLFREARCVSTDMRVKDTAAKGTHRRLLSKERRRQLSSPVDSLLWLHLFICL